MKKAEGHYETAFSLRVIGHLLQLTPFFLYLLQHLLFVFTQLEEQIASQTFGVNETIGGVFLTCS